MNYKTQLQTYLCKCKTKVHAPVNTNRKPIYNKNLFLSVHIICPFQDNITKQTILLLLKEIIQKADTRLEASFFYRCLKGLFRVVAKPTTFTS